MTEAQRKRIRQLAWQSKAINSRKHVAEILTLCGQSINDYQFVNEEQTQDFGETFWSKAKSSEEVDVTEFSQCFSLLREERWPRNVVVYLHCKARESGAIQIAVTNLLRSAGCLQSRLGPDFLFMDPKGKFGFCYEEGETHHVYRTWGQLAKCR